MGLNWVVQTQKQEDFFRKNIHKETLSYFLLLICKEITIIGDTITNLQVDTTRIKLLNYFVKRNKLCFDIWTYHSLLSHPGNFTPVFTTKLGKMARYAYEFNKQRKGVLLLGISCNDLESHKEWIKAIEAHTPGVKIWSNNY
jgi:alkyl hydroperoxide reductase subunit AhpC